MTAPLVWGTACVGQVGNLRPIVNRPGAVSGEKLLTRVIGAIANRPQVNNLPHRRLLRQQS